MVVAYAFHCLRLPYFLMIKAAGHYKQTQYCFIFSTIAKIIISILMAEICGLKGVAIGTIVAIGGQTIYLSGYVYRILLNRKWRTFWKRIVMDALMLCLIILLGGFFSMATVSYISWLVLAIKETLLSIVIVVLVNFLFGRKEVKCFLRKV
jgi:O-antigen/teichoic acid export membrane protein